MEDKRLDLIAKTAGVSLKNVCKVLAAVQLVTEYQGKSLEEVVYQEILDTTPPCEKQMERVDDIFALMVNHYDSRGNSGIVLAVRRLDGPMFKVATPIKQH